MEAETIRSDQVSSIANVAGRSPRQFRTWQSQGFTADSFRVGAKGVSCRSGSVNETSRVDSQKAVPVVHKYAFPDLFSFQAVTATYAGPPRPNGEIGGGRERPPLFAARCGRGGAAQFTFAQHPLGGSLPSKISLREGPCEDS